MLLARLLTFAAILAAVVTPALADKNIFDDDWTPPSTHTTKTAPAKPVPAPPSVEGPVPPPALPPPSTPGAVVTPQPAPSAIRLPAPTAAQQAAVRKAMKEVFAAQLADRTPTGRGKLAVS